MLRNEQASSWKKVNELNSTERKEGMLQESNESISAEWDKEKCSWTNKLLTEEKIQQSHQL